MNFNLNDYLLRIGYTPAGSDKDILFAVHLAHLRSIPFENLNVFAGLGISLAPEDLFRKLVTDKRGGYCFEMNSLLCDALLAMGFDAEGRIARVARPNVGFGPMLHRINLVRLGGETWVADVGFGGDVFEQPLLLEPELVQRRGGADYRLMRIEGGWSIQISRGGEFSDMLGFADGRSVPEDFEVGNFYTSRHPTSGFAMCVMCARAIEDGRVSLFNNRLTVRDSGGERRTELAAQDIPGALYEHFGIAPEKIPPIDWARLTVST